MRSTPRLPVRCRVDRCRKRGSRSASQAALGRNEPSGVGGELRFRKQATMRNGPDWNLAGGSRPYERARCPFTRHLHVETIAKSIGTRHPWTVLLIGSTLARRLQISGAADWCWDVRSSEGLHE